MILVVLATLFATCLITANIIAVKLVTIGGWVVPAGIIAYPLTFLFTDVVGELYGRRMASRVVWVGFGASLLMVLLVYGGKLLLPAPFWGGQVAYESILGMVPRVTLASMAAYLISQHHDVLAFHFWRQRTKGRFLWLRNNASTMVSQVLDTVIFIGVAFTGTVTAETLFSMMLYQYLIKLAIALADTPFCYLLVYWLRGRGGPVLPADAQVLA